MGSDRDFDDIYANYMGWARLQDVGKYEDTYNLRGKHAMEYYDGTNWSTANYYLYENQGTWTVNADGAFDTQWTLPITEDNILDHIKIKDLAYHSPGFHTMADRIQKILRNTVLQFFRLAHIDNLPCFVTHNVYAGSVGQVVRFFL